jgi:hypothetical protein
MIAHILLCAAAWVEHAARLPPNGTDAVAALLSSQVNCAATFDQTS